MVSCEYMTDYKAYFAGKKITVMGHRQLGNPSVFRRASALPSATGNRMVSLQELSTRWIFCFVPHKISQRVLRSCKYSLLTRPLPYAQALKLFL